LATTAITYGCYFYYDGTNVNAICINGAGNSTSVDCGAADNGWHKYFIVLTSSSAKFYRDATWANGNITGGTLLTTINTNLPTQPFCERMVIIKSAGTTSRSLLVDWVFSSYLFTTALTRF